MAGTISFAHYQRGIVRRLVITATADAADGSFPATALPAIDGFLITMITNPGAVAPTANYDIVITDVDSVDRLQGVGANRHTSNTEAASIVYSATTLHPPVDPTETLTLAITGNSVNSAVTVITLFYARVLVAG